MRDDRIQYTRHPNLRQHVISRFKNRTNHALPNPDISLATDSRLDFAFQRPGTALASLQPATVQSDAPVDQGASDPKGGTDECRGPEPQGLPAADWLCRHGFGDG